MRRPTPTPLRLRCADPRLRHPLPLRGPDRPGLPSSIPALARTPGPGAASPSLWARRLTCPALLRRRPCWSLRRLRERGPPARHISRNRSVGEMGEGWRGECGLRVPSFSRPSTATTNQKLKKKKKSGLHHSKGGPLAAAKVPDLGRAGPRPSRGGRRQGRRGGGGVRARGVGARRSPPRRRRRRPASPPQLRGPDGGGTCAPRRLPSPRRRRPRG